MSITENSLKTSNWVGLESNTNLGSGLVETEKANVLLGSSSSLPQFKSTTQSLGLQTTAPVNDPPSKASYGNCAFGSFLLPIWVVL